MEGAGEGAGNMIKMAKGLQQLPCKGRLGRLGPLGEENMVQGDHSCTSLCLLVVELEGS